MIVKEGVEGVEKHPDVEKAGSVPENVLTQPEVP